MCLLFGGYNVVQLGSRQRGRGEVPTVELRHLEIGIVPRSEDSSVRRFFLHRPTQGTVGLCLSKSNDFAPLVGEAPKGEPLIVLADEGEDRIHSGARYEYKRSAMSSCLIVFLVFVWVGWVIALAEPLLL